MNNLTSSTFRGQALEDIKCGDAVRIRYDMDTGKVYVALERNESNTGKTVLLDPTMDRRGGDREREGRAL